MIFQFDLQNCQPYVYNETSQIMISYDDARSFKAKGNFIKSSGLRGFAMWEAGGDKDDQLLDAISKSLLLFACIRIFLRVFA